MATLSAVITSVKTVSEINQGAQDNLMWRGACLSGGSRLPMRKLDWLRRPKFSQHSVTPYFHNMLNKVLDEIIYSFSNSNGVGDKWFHPTLYNGYNNLCMLWLDLILVDKSDPSLFQHEYSTASETYFLNSHWIMYANRMDISCDPTSIAASSIRYIYSLNLL